MELAAQLMSLGRVLDESLRHELITSSTLTDYEKNDKLLTWLDTSSSSSVRDINMTAFIGALRAVNQLHVVGLLDDGIPSSEFKQNC